MTAFIAVPFNIVLREFAVPASTELINCESHPSHIIVTLTPALVDQSWADVESASSRVMIEVGARQNPTCVMDLTPLTYMGSSMVALVVKFWKAIRSKEGRMVVACNHEFVLEVLKLAALDKLWPIVPDRSAALKQLKLRDSGVSLGSPAVSNGAGGYSIQATPAAFVSGPSSVSGGWGWIIAGGFLLAGAAGLLLAGPRLQMPTVYKLAGLEALCGLGLICALFTLVFRRGAQQIVGIILTLVSFGLAVAGVLNARPVAAPPAAEQPAADEKAEKSDDKKADDAPAAAPKPAKSPDTNAESPSN